MNTSNESAHRSRKRLRKPRQISCVSFDWMVMHEMKTNFPTFEVLRLIYRAHSSFASDLKLQLLYLSAGKLSVRKRPRICRITAVTSATCVLIR